MYIGTARRHLVRIQLNAFTDHVPDNGRETYVINLTVQRIL